MKLGFHVTERTVARYLPKRERNPDKIARWMAFLRNHREGIAAMDLFVVPTATFRLHHDLIVIEHGGRRLLNWAVTEHPTAEWVVRVLRDAFPYDEGPEYLIHDRDAIFGARVKEAIKRMGTRSKQTAFHCPWQNPIAERFIGSIRRDLLDHVVILGQDHLARLLSEYIRYYHADRTHLGLDKDCPEPRTVTPRPREDAALVALPRVGGIHHRYEWRVPA